MRGLNLVLSPFLRAGEEGIASGVGRETEKPETVTGILHPFTGERLRMEESYSLV